MAIKLEFINVIVPNTTIEAAFAEQGGFEFFKQSYGAMRDMVWYDDYICRADGAMNWADVEDMVHWWEELGLIGLADTDTGKERNGGICALLRQSLNPPIAVAGLSSTPWTTPCLCEARRKDGPWERHSRSVNTE
jgi:hypothetical protein